ncbi:MAG: pyridoxine 5'-phosphate synthase [bacterium]
MPPRLGVNIDHVATLRQARGNVPYPDPVAAAVLAGLAGADQITVHLREDRRHIQDRDVKMLKDVVQTRLNLEMANVPEMVKVAMYLKPYSVCLVPERREEVTTEGGLDVNLHLAAIKKTVGMLQEAEILVSLFIDPDVDQVRASHKAGADAVEIHTGRYCDSMNEAQQDREFQSILNACKGAKKLGLRVHAGHGLHYHNTARLTAIQEIEEYNIGHAIIARAVLVGMDRAVREMKAIITGRA